MSMLDLTKASAILKELYDGQEVTQLMYKDSPLFALMPKDEDFLGKEKPLPNRVSDPQGASADFRQAQLNKRSSLYEAFKLTRDKDYSVASIDTETMLASASDVGAFVRAAKAEMDGAIRTMARRHGWKTYGDGTGSMGNATAAVNGGICTISMVDPDAIAKIEVNQTVELRQAAGTLRTFTGPTNTTQVVVNTVNRSAGTFTVIGSEGEAISAVSGTASTDFVCVAGDYNKSFRGVAAWIPVVAPSATPFFGVNRTVDSERLAGVRMSGAGKPQDEALADAARLMGRAGASPTHLMTNFTKYSALEKILGSKVRYVDEEIAGIAFRAIEIAGPSRSIKVLADRDCPGNLQYMLTIEDWAFESLGQAGRILDQDGNTILRDPFSDSYEVRIGSYGQFRCVNPGHSGVITY